MSRIGVIDEARLRHLPEKYHAAHEFCFHLHDQMAALLVEMESTGANEVSVSLSDESERDLLESSESVIDFLNSTGRSKVADRVILNTINMALFSDMLHFLYEALISLEKRKFTVAFSLMRKPLKEGFILASWICADEAEFLENLKLDPAKTFDQGEISPEKKISLIEGAKGKCKGSDFIASDQIYSIIYDRKNEYGLAPLFDKATHLVTRNPHIATEQLNINFIFKNPLDNDIYDNIYADLAKILMFMNLIQIELYSRMGAVKEKYKNWLLLTSLGVYGAIFLKGRPPLLRFVNSTMKEFMNCPGCDTAFKIGKAEAPSFFIRETVTCRECGMEHHFPLGWLLSKVEWTLE